MSGLLFPVSDDLLIGQLLAEIDLQEMGFMGIVTILIIATCALLALFNSWNLCRTVMVLVRYLRHPHRDFLNHVKEVAAMTTYCRDCQYRGKLAWQEGVDQAFLEPLPDQDIFCCDQCGSDQWELITDE
ncbi:MAG: hypothetical protein GY888_01850 [Planctomycetaceae bacterium]|nr:hypothetical protein [Planctomycetaceae bacterium]